MIRNSADKLIDAAKAFGDHKHTGSGSSDILWDLKLQELKDALKQYEKDRRLSWWRRIFE
jgi:hypothetical protein